MDRGPSGLEAEARRRAPPDAAMGDPPLRIRDHVHRRELGVDRPMGSPCVHKDRRAARQGDADCAISVPEYGLTAWVQAAVEVDRAALRLHKRVPTQACRDRRDAPVARDRAGLAADPGWVYEATHPLQ